MVCGRCVLTRSTWIALFGLGNTDRNSSLRATGIALLFSAGTFLYVSACHVLPEISRQRKRGSSGQRPSHVLAIVAGAFVPSVLSLGHSHG